MKNSYSDNSFRLSYSLWELKQVNRFVNPIYALGKFSFNYQMFRLYSYITYTYTCSFVLFSGSLITGAFGVIAATMPAVCATPAVIDFGVCSNDPPKQKISHISIKFGW